MSNQVPAQAALSRLGRVEFFANLPPGFYLFLLIPIVALSYLHYHEFVVLQRTRQEFLGNCVEAATPSPASGTGRTTNKSASGAAPQSPPCAPLKSIVFAPDDVEYESELTPDRKLDREYLSHGVLYNAVRRDFQNSAETPYIDLRAILAYHWAIFEWMINRFQRQPLLLVFVLFLSYIFGTAVRSMKVTTAERPTRLESLFSNERDQTDWPFVDKMDDNIRHARQVLKEQVPIFRMQSEEKPGQPKDDFSEWDNFFVNFMKIYIAVKTPHAFEWYQGFEARTRFLSGMTHAARLGFVFGLSFLVFYPILSWLVSEPREKTSLVSFLLWNINISGILYLSFSILLFLLLRRDLKKDRLREAETLTALFCCAWQRPKERASRNAPRATVTGFPV